MFCLLSAFRWMTSVFQGRPMGLDYGLHHVRMAPILLCPPDVWFHKDNYPEPGKRPLSSTTPTIIENADGSFYLSIGGSGGSRIFPAVFQVLLNLDWGLNLSEAIEFGRLHDQLYPLFLDADNVYPSDLLDDLRSRGHNVTGMIKYDEITGIYITDFR